MKLKKMRHKNINAELGFALYKTGMLFRREGLKHGMNKKVAPEQWQVMMVLKRKNGMTQKEIGELTVQDAPTLSRSIKRMVLRGLVKKKKGKKDRRATLIYLTPSGERLMKSIGKETVAHINSILKDFPERKKKAIIKLLEELRDYFGPDK